MNKVELLQEKYNAKKNDMSKEELLEFNERLFKSFLSDKKFNDGVFWAYSEITDRVIEDLKEKNEKLLNDTDFERFGKSEYIKKLEFEAKHYRRLAELKESEKNKIRTDNKELEMEIELNRVTEDNGRLEKNMFEAKRYIERLENMLSVESQTIVGLNAELKKEKSLSDKLRYQVKSREQAIKEKRDIVIDEVIEQLEKEIMYYNIFQPRTARELIHLKTKIKEMGNK